MRCNLALLSLCALLGCTREGTYYGGGDGLELEFSRAGGETTTLAWSGATRSDLRANWGGDYAFTSVATEGGWTVQVTDEFVFSDELLPQAGIACRDAIDQLAVRVSQGGLRMVVTMGEQSVTLGVDGPSSGDGLSGSLTGDIEYAGNVPGSGDGCTEDGAITPADTLSATWSFDEGVKHANNCYGCGTLDVPVTFDIDF